MSDNCYYKRLENLLPNDGSRYQDFFLIPLCSLGCLELDLRLVCLSLVSFDSSILRGSYGCRCSSAKVFMGKCETLGSPLSFKRKRNTHQNNFMKTISRN